VTRDTVERWRSGRRWYWHRKAGNGQVVSNAGPFMTSWGCLRNVRRRNPDLTAFPIRGAE
jgi:hypothetical protein